MISRMTVAVLLMLVLTSEVRSFEANVITVCILNAKNGKPMKGAIAQIIIGTAHDPNWSDPGARFLYQKTRDDGVATFDLGPTPPKTMFVEDASGLSAQCAGGEFSLIKIQSEGIVQANQCGKVRGPVPPAKPGEVILFTRHLRWWEAGQT